MSKKDKKKKVKYIDDGHTIYNMNVEGMRGYKKSSESADYIDKHEKRILIWAAFKAYAPKLLIVILGFTLAIILIYFWLR